MRKRTKISPIVPVALAAQASPKKLNIAGYCRISVDLELDRDNTSIEHQKAIISEFVQRNFPEAALTFYEDRDRSGYTFDQREAYQRLRPLLLDNTYDVLIVKDLSRFSRRNGRGLAEFEDLVDAGVRVVSIGDDIDYPARDDRTKVQLYFFINEMPVTETSKKVRNVIHRLQEDGKWLTAVPYGYVITNYRTGIIAIDPQAAQVVRMIFELYNSGWGYKRIANHLSDLHIPTARMDEKARAEARGDVCKLQPKQAWSIASVKGILENDFYIGTLRQGKYSRKKINGEDVKKDAAEHIVFENHHEPIVDFRTFAITQEQLRQRTRDNYRGVKKYANTYSGFLTCGDCGEPMFAVNHAGMPEAYACSSYHKRGRKACTRHHLRADSLDVLLKAYLTRIRENSAAMLQELEANLRDEAAAINSNEQLSDRLEQQLAEAREELKATKRQKIRELARKPDAEELIEETYAELEAECEARVNGLLNQIDLTQNRRNTIIRAGRVARTAIGVFDEILTKERLDKQDLSLLIEQIYVYEDHVDVKLKADIDSLLRCGHLAGEDSSAAPQHDGICDAAAAPQHDSVPPEGSVNFSSGAADILTCIRQSSAKHEDKVYRANVISEGDPLEIFVEKDGEIILKKYSPIGELSALAREYCESINETLGQPVFIADRDSIIAVSGAAKKDFLGKAVGRMVERSMAERRMYMNNYQDPRESSDGNIIAEDQGEDSYRFLSELIIPIVAQGDPVGAVVICGQQEIGDTERKVAQSAAGVIARQMEQ